MKNTGTDGGVRKNRGLVIIRAAAAPLAKDGWV
jgi:hypothetical protein